MSNTYVDFHCHPAMKPFGQSFKSNPGQNDSNRRSKSSIWHYDSPQVFERGLQMLAGISKFTQSDCTTLAYGNTRLICASLYPIESGFFRNDLGSGIASELAASFITGVGEQRADFIQNIKDYFSDLENEYNFYKQLDGVSVKTDGGTYRYVLVKDYASIESQISTDHGQSTIYIIMTIEGLHALNSNFGGPVDEQSFLGNLRKLKQWDHVPFFVTFSHHFFNELCGHAKSLFDLVGNLSNQLKGLGEPFTELGLKVLKEALSTTNGKRIYIDIKHMSPAGRKQYLSMLSNDFPGEHIPVIISHGACNGLRSVDEPVVDLKDTGVKFLPEGINFYDNEIIALAKSNGIIALQLDERRLANENTVKNVKHSVFMNKIRHYRAELLWNQVQHIAELLDKNDLFAWGNIGIGSDFDGIINPLNGFLTSETMPVLLEYLERYVHNYMGERGKQMKSYNQISPSDIVNRIFTTNGQEFIRKWYI